MKQQKYSMQINVVDWQFINKASRKKKQRKNTLKNYMPNKNNRNISKWKQSGCKPPRDPTFQKAKSYKPQKNMKAAI